MTTSTTNSRASSNSPLASTSTTSSSASLATSSAAVDAMPPRPTPGVFRQQSYTHSFPSSRSPASSSSSNSSSSSLPPSSVSLGANTAGLSEETKALARQAFQPSSDMRAEGDDRTLLFYGGLQWLLNATVQAGQEGVGARKIEFMDGNGGKTGGGVAGEGMGQEGRTEDWVVGRMKGSTPP